MKNSYCIKTISLCLPLILCEFNSHAQIYEAAHSQIIRIEDNSFRYFLQDGSKSPIVFAECLVRQVDEDVLILESGISGDYALDGTRFSLSCGTCSADSVKIEISLNVMEGRVYCEYSDDQSERPKVSECNLVNKEGLLRIPATDRRPIIVRSIYFIPGEDGFPDFHYFETTREVIRTFLIKNETDAMRIEGGTKVVVTNNDIKNYRPTDYAGDHILITEGGLIWRGTFFKRIGDEKWTDAL